MRIGHLLATCMLVALVGFAASQSCGTGESFCALGCGCGTCMGAGFCECSNALQCCGATNCTASCNPFQQCTSGCNGTTITYSCITNTTGCPCLNGGRCNEAHTACDCEDTGYSGTFCSDPICSHRNCLCTVPGTCPSCRAGTFCPANQANITGCNSCAGPPTVVEAECGNCAAAIIHPGDTILVLYELEFQPLPFEAAVVFVGAAVRLFIECANYVDSATLDVDLGNCSQYLIFATTASVTSPNATLIAPDLCGGNSSYTIQAAILVARVAVNNTFTDVLISFFIRVGTSAVGMWSDAVDANAVPTCDIPVEICDSCDQQANGWSSSTTTQVVTPVASVVVVFFCIASCHKASAKCRQCERKSCKPCRKHSPTCIRKRLVCCCGTCCGISKKPVCLTPACTPQGCASPTFSPISNK